MTLTWIDHILFVLVTIVFPITDFRGLRRKRAAIRDGRDDLRAGMYRSIIWQEWLMVAVLLTVWFTLGRTADTLGTIQPFVPWTPVGYALTAIAIVVLLAQVPLTLNSPKNRAAVSQQLASVSFLLPHTATERRLYAMTAVTAGICEEVIFRGYLIAYLMALTGIPVWAAIGVSAAIFGWAHIYQGRGGAIRAGMVGLGLGAFYGLTGSLWAPMILHALMDLVSGHIGTRVIEDGDVSQAGELAAGMRDIANR